jgi:hypothetical protein
MSEGRAAVSIRRPECLACSSIPTRRAPSEVGRLNGPTYENVSVRLLCADLHPDHDSICTFRRANHALLKSSFEQVLAMAVQMRVLKVGHVSLAVDGTKILANASKHSAVSHGRALAQIELLEKQVAELLSTAEAADSAPLEDGLTLTDRFGAVARGQRSHQSWQA